MQNYMLFWRLIVFCICFQSIDYRESLNLSVSDNISRFLGLYVVIYREYQYMYFHVWRKLVTFLVRKCVFFNENIWSLDPPSRISKLPWSRDDEIFPSNQLRTFKSSATIFPLSNFMWLDQYTHYSYILYSKWQQHDFFHLNSEIPPCVLGWATTNNTKNILEECRSL